MSESRATPPYRRWANRAIPHQVDRERARSWWRVVLALVLAATPFAVYVVEKNECVRLSYAASALRQRRDELGERERRLRMERATLQSLDKIETWALTEQGLARPPAEQILVARRPRRPVGSGAP